MHQMSPGVFCGNIEPNGSYLRDDRVRFVDLEGLDGLNGLLGLLDPEDAFTGSKITFVRLDQCMKRHIRDDAQGDDRLLYVTYCM